MFGELEYQDLGVTPCGARFGKRKGKKGAARLPRILVLIICYLALGAALVPGSWGNTMRGAVRYKEWWRRRRTPTQDPSTNHLLSCTGCSISTRILG